MLNVWIRIRHKNWKKEGGLIYCNTFISNISDLHVPKKNIYFCKDFKNLVFILHIFTFQKAGDRQKLSLNLEYGV